MALPTFFQFEIPWLLFILILLSLIAKAYVVGIFVCACSLPKEPISRLETTLDRTIKMQAETIRFSAFGISLIVSKRYERGQCQ